MGALNDTLSIQKTRERRKQNVVPITDRRNHTNVVTDHRSVPSLIIKLELMMGRFIKITKIVVINAAYMRLQLHSDATQRRKIATAFGNAIETV